MMGSLEVPVVNGWEQVMVMIWPEVNFGPKAPSLLQVERRFKVSLPRSWSDADRKTLVLLFTNVVASYLSKARDPLCAGKMANLKNWLHVLHNSSYANKTSLPPYMSLLGEKLSALLNSQSCVPPVPKQDTQAKQPQFVDPLRVQTSTFVDPSTVTSLHPQGHRDPSQARAGHRGPSQASKRKPIKKFEKEAMQSPINLDDSTIDKKTEKTEYEVFLKLSQSDTREGKILNAIMVNIVIIMYKDGPIAAFDYLTNVPLSPINSPDDTYRSGLMIFWRHLILFLLSRFHLHQACTALDGLVNFFRRGHYGSDKTDWSTFYPDIDFGVLTHQFEILQQECQIILCSLVGHEAQNLDKVTCGMKGKCWKSGKCFDASPKGFQDSLTHALTTWETSLMESVERPSNYESWTQDFVKRAINNEKLEPADWRRVVHETQEEEKPPQKFKGQCKLEQKLHKRQNEIVTMIQTMIELMVRVRGKIGDAEQQRLTTFQQQAENITSLMQNCLNSQFETKEELEGCINSTTEDLNDLRRKIGIFRKELEGIENSAPTVQQTNGKKSTSWYNSWIFTSLKTILVGAWSFTVKAVSVMASVAKSPFGLFRKASPLIAIGIGLVVLAILAVSWKVWAIAKVMAFLKSMALTPFLYLFYLMRKACSFLSFKGWGILFLLVIIGTLVKEKFNPTDVLRLKAIQGSFSLWWRILNLFSGFCTISSWFKDPRPPPNPTNETKKVDEIKDSLKNTKHAQETSGSEEAPSARGASGASEEAPSEEAPSDEAPSEEAPSEEALSVSEVSDPLPEGVTVRRTATGFEITGDFSNLRRTTEDGQLQEYDLETQEWVDFEDLDNASDFPSDVATGRELVTAVMETPRPVPGVLYANQSTNATHLPPPTPHGTNRTFSLFRPGSHPFQNFIPSTYTLVSSDVVPLMTVDHATQLIKNKQICWIPDVEQSNILTMCPIDATTKSALVSVPAKSLSDDFYSAVAISHRVPHSPGSGVVVVHPDGREVPANMTSSDDLYSAVAISHSVPHSPGSGVVVVHPDGREVPANMTRTAASDANPIRIVMSEKTQNGKTVIKIHSLSPSATPLLEEMKNTYPEMKGIIIQNQTHEQNFVKHGVEKLKPDTTRTVVSDLSRLPSSQSTTKPPPELPPDMSQESSFLGWNSILEYFPTNTLSLVSTGVDVTLSTYSVYSTAALILGGGLMAAPLTSVVAIVGALLSAGNLASYFQSFVASTEFQFLNMTDNCERMALRYRANAAVALKHMNDNDNQDKRPCQMYVNWGNQQDKVDNIELPSNSSKIYSMGLLFLTLISLYKMFQKGVPTSEAESRSLINLILYVKHTVPKHLRTSVLSWLNALLAAAKG